MIGAIAGVAAYAALIVLCAAFEHYLDRGRR